MPASQCDETGEKARKDTKTRKCNAGRFGVGVAVGGAVGLALFFGLYFGLPPRTVTVDHMESTSASPSTTTSSPLYSKVFSNAAVAADASQCSTIGKDILQKGGSAVDSAIAAMLCVGIHNSHSCGIGGGFFMTYYEAATGKATFINAREMAPANSNENMFNGNGRLSLLGSLAVAVPGEIAGYWEAHQKYGKRPWAELFAPSINLAENGFIVKRALASAIKSQADVVHNRTFNMWPVFENEDGSLKEQGDIIRLPQLAKTLKKVAAEGANAFYNGSLASDIVDDLKDGYGDSIITKDDLANYRTQIKPAINISVDDYTIFSPGPPSSGAVLSLIVNILDGYNFTSDSLSNDKKILTYHRIVEAFRFAYAKRSRLGDDTHNKTIVQLVQNMTSEWFADSLRQRIDDKQTHPIEYYEPDFQLPDDHGTSHLSIYASNGDAVSMTSTINTYFGSKVRGARTGIIFNNEMDDFSSPNITNVFESDDVKLRAANIADWKPKKLSAEYADGVPPSPSNFIRPGNRPMSSMTPAVVIKIDQQSGENEVRLINGAAGGTKITTSTATTMMNCLWFGDDIGASIEKKRIHDQLMPNLTSFESGFDQDVINGLIDKGHKYEIRASAGSIVQGVLIRDDGKVEAACDSRKGGTPDGY